MDLRTNFILNWVTRIMDGDGGGSMKTKQNNDECKHCNQPISLRNPSGHCDHLKYPENCNVCSKTTGSSQHESKLREFAEEVINQYKDTLRKLGSD